MPPLRSAGRRAADLGAVVVAPRALQEQPEVVVRGRVARVDAQHGAVLAHGAVDIAPHGLATTRVGRRR